MNSLDLEVEKKLHEQVERIGELEYTCLFVKKFLVAIEKTSETDPLLRQILRTRHAPMHTLLDKALRTAFQRAHAVEDQPARDPQKKRPQQKTKKEKTQ